MSLQYNIQLMKKQGIIHNELSWVLKMAHIATSCVANVAYDTQTKQIFYDREDQNNQNIQNQWPSTAALEPQ